MTQLIQPAILFVIAILLLEAVGVFFLKRYYDKKLREQQQRFAGYLQELDEENKRLKRKIAKKG